MHKLQVVQTETDIRTLSVTHHLTAVTAM